MTSAKPKDLIGCCGLYCGLCAKYQSTAPSRCLGCKIGEQHSWCSIWKCCAKKHGMATCAECADVFSCPVFLRRRVADWVPAAATLRQIGESGLERVLAEQEERRALLEGLLRDYNDGRSMSFYCKACARMPGDLIDKAVKEVKKRIEGRGSGASDTKSKARAFREAITGLASEAGIDLK